MRLLLLALIFFLLLTLGNVWLLKRAGPEPAVHDAAPPLQATQTSPNPSPGRERLDAFVWREIGAFVLTIVVFGGIASLGPSRGRG